MIKELDFTDVLYNESLYSLDRAGKIRVFNVLLRQRVINNHYAVETSTGLLGGRLLHKTTNIHKGKGGRSCLEQAMLEYRSLQKEKIDEGYKSQTDLALKAASESIDLNDPTNIVELFSVLKIKYNTDKNWLPLPMLALPFKKFEKHLIYPCYIQPKLNGVRCLASYDTETSEVILRSREGMVYEVPHISSQLKAYLKFNQDVILDGELYKHGERLQVISGAARGKESEKEWLEYHIYDIINNTPQCTRLIQLQTIEVEFRQINSDKIFTVQSIIVDTRQQLMEFHTAYTELGYEGAMVRNTKALYEPSFRSNNLLKVKMFEDEEFEIAGHEVSFDEGIVKPDTFVFILKNNIDEQTFKCKPTGTGEQKVIWWKKAEWLIGSRVIVRFQERSKDGLPIQAHIRHADSVVLTDVLNNI